MRKLVLGLVIAATLVGGPAMAASPSGSKESKTNTLTCNGTTGPAEGGVNVYAGGNGAYAGSNGLEVCSDDDSAIDGRLILSPDGYGAADGDDSNPDQAQGWARLDGSGLNCGGESDPKTDKDNDVTHGEAGAACGA
jgi:hypothetical protein